MTIINCRPALIPQKQKNGNWNPLADENPVRLPSAGGAVNSRYEGLIPKFERIFLSKDFNRMKGKRKEMFERVVKRKPRTSCRGARLNQKALNCKINGLNIADCSQMQADHLLEFIKKIDSTNSRTITHAVTESLEQLIEVGLGYLSLSRETATLVGGQSNSGFFLILLLWSGIVSSL